MNEKVPLAALPEFKSRQPHDISQPPVTGSDALLWPAGIQTDTKTAHIRINK